MRDKTIIGDRVEIPKWAKEQIRDIMLELNRRSAGAVTLTPKNTLDMLIDRGYCVMFPERKSKARRKKYQVFPF